MRNSTIKIKQGNCEICGKYGPLTSKKCQNCYWNGIRLKSVQKQAQKEEDHDDPDVATLKKDLDLIFSRWLRMSGADKDGICECFICGHKDHFSKMQAGHFVKRGNSFLRYDCRNVKINCKNCNECKGGNYPLYTKRLEQESPGITEYLTEEGNLTYKFTRQELKDMIADYYKRLKQLQ